MTKSKNSMAPPRWTSVEQEAWLQPWYEKFKAKQGEKSKNYKNFFADLCEQWFEEFPEPRPGHITQVGPLTLMEMGAAHDARKTPRRFKIGQKGKGKYNDITECKKSTHMLQEQEAYSKLFYTTHVQPTVKGSLEKAAQEHRTLTNGEHVALVKKETAMLYAQESPDIKDQVKQYLEDQKRQRIQDKQIGRRQMCVAPYHQLTSASKRNLDKLAAVANSFLKGLAEATGMLFSLLAGGPSPEALGAIDIYSFHVGQTKLGNNFSTTYPGFDAGVMEPFQDFLHRVYPEAGVSSPQQQEGSSGTGGDTRDSSSHLDIYKSGSTSGSVSNALSTGDVSL
ncbi:uncharacterized protein F5891DRAFT_979451 [Suillus fuscotomentosus]|uniref:Uncharacterized protein n=1 Tax=Suillus fuscotomentosus TaxID=1912939 RepID=A0AAD4E8Q0_9AGAM|nr:uncharacterized protein F5891DRAFT_979451 [Suillus fuscotomentosus]KAG1901640.1 hypothetical protein F5891DRAFT_979451 [Suillus fuscotomentosus]